MPAPRGAGTPSWPEVFDRPVRFMIEQGTGNNRSEDFYSVAHWYETERRGKFPSLPSLPDRMPKVFAVSEGASPVKA